MMAHMVPVELEMKIWTLAAFSRIFQDQLTKKMLLSQCFEITLSFFLSAGSSLFFAFSRRIRMIRHRNVPSWTHLPFYHLLTQGQKPISRQNIGRWSTKQQTTRVWDFTSPCKYLENYQKPCDSKGYSASCTCVDHSSFLNDESQDQF
jgi:hypothetical protein